MKTLLVTGGTGLVGNSIKKLTLKPYYKNDSCIKNFMGLIDLSNMKDNHDDRSENKEACINIINKLINLLGYENPYDDKQIRKNQFDQNIQMVYSNSVLFTDQKTAKILFKQSKTDIDPKNNKAVMGYLNTVLKNYGLKIESSYTEGKKKITDNLKYRLIQLNNINEVVHNLMKKGKKINDPLKMIKEPTNYVYTHLITTTKEPEPAASSLAGMQPEPEPEIKPPIKSD
jgi:hypothetical protein